MDAAMACRQSQPADTARVGEPARRLFHLVLAWFEASTPVRLHWPSSDLDDAFLAHRIVYVGPSLDADCADRRPVCRLLIAGRTRPGCATRTR